MPRSRPVAHVGVPPGDAAQMEQIRQSLVKVATDAAEIAAQRTVERLFVGLGVDVSKPESIIELQKTLTFASNLRGASQTIRKTGLRAAVGIIVSAFFGVLLLGFKDWIKLP